MQEGLVGLGQHEVLMRGPNVLGLQKCPGRTTLNNHDLISTFASRTLKPLLCSSSRVEFEWTTKLI